MAEPQSFADAIKSLDKTMAGGTEKQSGMIGDGVGLIKKNVLGFLAGQKAFQAVKWVLEKRRDKKKLIEDRKVLADHLGINKKVYENFAREKKLSDQRKIINDKLMEGAKALGINAEKLAENNGNVSSVLELSLDELKKSNKLMKSPKLNAADHEVANDNEIREEKQMNIFERMAKSLEGIGKGDGGGFGAVFFGKLMKAGAAIGELISLITGLVIAPLIIVISFFGEVIREALIGVKIIKDLKLTPNFVKNIFAPLTAGIKSAFTRMGGTAVKDLITNIRSTAGQLVTSATTWIKKALFGKYLGPDGKLKVGNVFDKPTPKWIKFAISPIESINKFFTGLKTTFTSATEFITKNPIFKRITGIAKLIGTWLGKILWPITAIIALFDFWTGASDEWKKTEGEATRMRVLKSAWEGFKLAISNFFGLPLDLLKDGISWVLKKVGLEKASSALDSFSFVDLFKGIFDVIRNMFSKLEDWMRDKVGNTLSDVLFGEETKEKKAAREIREKHKKDKEAAEQLRIKLLSAKARFDEIPDAGTAVYGALGHKTSGMTTEQVDNKRKLQLEELEKLQEQYKVLKEKVDQNNASRQGQAAASNNTNFDASTTTNNTNNHSGSAVNYTSPLPHYEF